MSNLDFGKKGARFDRTVRWPTFTTMALDAAGDGGTFNWLFWQPAIVVGGAALCYTNPAVAIIVTLAMMGASIAVRMWYFTRYALDDFYCNEEYDEFISNHP